MNAVNLVILLENVVCVLVHEHWVVEGAEVLPLDVAAPVPVMMVMGAGVIVHVGEDLLLYAAAPHHLLLDVDGATAGLPRIVMLVVLHLMPMGTKLELDLSKCWMDVERMISICYNVVLIGLVELTRTMLVMLMMLWHCFLLETWIWMASLKCFCRQKGCLGHRFASAFSLRFTETQRSNSYFYVIYYLFIYVFI